MIPTVIIAWVCYHLLWLFDITAFDVDPVSVLDTAWFAIPLPGNAQWLVSGGDVINALTVTAGFMEVTKASALRRSQLIDHFLSMLLFAGALVEFLYFRPAQTSVFFLILLALFLDVTVGYVVGIRVARRDFTIDR